MMTTTTIQIVPDLDARRLHIKLVARQLRQVEKDRDDLRQVHDVTLLDETATHLKRQLSSLDAWTCDCCGAWVHCENGRNVDVQENAGAKCQDDEVWRQDFICQECIDCPPDEPER